MKIAGLYYMLVGLSFRSKGSEEADALAVIMVALIMMLAMVAMIVAFMTQRVFIVRYFFISSSPSIMTKSAPIIVRL